MVDSETAICSDTSAIRPAVRGRFEFPLLLRQSCDGLQKCVVSGLQTLEGGITLRSRQGRWHRGCGGFERCLPAQASGRGTARRRTCIGFSFISPEFICRCEIGIAVGQLSTAPRQSANCPGGSLRASTSPVLSQTSRCGTQPTTRQTQSGQSHREPTRVAERNQRVARGR